jgi:hypothetical protein
VNAERARNEVEKIRNDQKDHIQPKAGLVDNARVVRMALPNKVSISQLHLPFGERRWSATLGMMVLDVRIATPENFPVAPDAKRDFKVFSLRIAVKEL